MTGLEMQGLGMKMYASIVLEEKWFDRDFSGRRFKGTVNRAEPYKGDICFVSKILWTTPLNHPFFKRKEIMTFDTHWWLSAIVSPYTLRSIPVKAAYFHRKKLAT